MTQSKFGKKNGFLSFLGRDDKYDANDKTITYSKTATVDDEAVNLNRLNTKFNECAKLLNLLPQQFSGRLLVNDYDSSDTSDRDAMNKKYIDDKFASVIGFDFSKAPC